VVNTAILELDPERVAVIEPAAWFPPIDSWLGEAFPIVRPVTGTS